MSKAKKTLTGGLIVMVGVLMFGLGALANVTWKTYDGDVTQSEDHVDEIMHILREVNADKLTAEDALASLEALNPAGLAKLNKELRERNTQLVADNEELGAYVRHLEAELTKANEAVDGLNGKTQDALGEARGIAK